MQSPAASESLLSFKLIIYSFLNLSWSGAKKGSRLGVNYLETSRQRGRRVGGGGCLVLKSSITLPWWTAYKRQSGNGRGWVGRGWQEEHHEEFAYTSQMKWHSSCRNIKMIQIVLKRVQKQQVRNLETCKATDGRTLGEIEQTQRLVRQVWVFPNWNEFPRDFPQQRVRRGPSVRWA